MIAPKIIGTELIWKARRLPTASAIVPLSAQPRNALAKLTLTTKPVNSKHQKKTLLVAEPQQSFKRQQKMTSLLQSRKLKEDLGLWCALQIRDPALCIGEVHSLLCIQNKSTHQGHVKLCQKDRASTCAPNECNIHKSALSNRLSSSWSHSARNIQFIDTPTLDTSLCMIGPILTHQLLQQPYCPWFYLIDPSMPYEVKKLRKE